MTPLEQFAWGCAGSLAVEVVTMFQRYNSGHLKLPPRYGRFGFWVVRALVAVIAGGLAVAYGVEQPLLAANVGAATPLIIKTFGETAPAPTPQVTHEVAKP